MGFLKEGEATQNSPVVSAGLGLSIPLQLSDLSEGITSIRSDRSVATGPFTLSLKCDNDNQTTGINWLKVGESGGYNVVSNLVSTSEIESRHRTKRSMSIINTCINYSGAWYWKAAFNLMSLCHNLFAITCWFPTSFANWLPKPTPKINNVTSCHRPSRIPWGSSLGVWWRRGRSALRDPGVWFNLGRHFLEAQNSAKRTCWNHSFFYISMIYNRWTSNICVIEWWAHLYCTPPWYWEAELFHDHRDVTNASTLPELR